MQIESSDKPSKTHLPMTSPILKKNKELWDVRQLQRDYVIPQASMTLSLFGFFQSGEITVPAKDAFNARTHLSLGELAIGNPEKKTGDQSLSTPLKDKPVLFGNRGDHG